MTQTSTPKVIMLAAGQSSRFGSHKVMHPMADGLPMILHSLKPYQQNSLSITVICNYQHHELHRLLTQQNIAWKIASQAHQGMGHSLAQAIQQCPSEQGWLIALADMPYLTQSSIKKILPQCRDKICRPQHNQQAGHPVYFPTHYQPQLIKLTGDQGAKKIVKQQPVSLVPLDDPGCLLDIDTPEDI